MTELKELLDKLNEISVNQAITNTKLDAMGVRIDAQAISDEKKFKDHEDRIRASERKHWYFGGVAAVLAFIGSIVGRDFFSGGG